MSYTELFCIIPCVQIIEFLPPKVNKDPCPTQTSSSSPQSAPPSALANPTARWHPFQPVELASLVMREAVKRAGIDPARLDDAIWGVVTPIGDQGGNLARLAVLKAGFPVHVPGVSLNRMCGSSQQAVHFAAQAILSGDADIVIAGGTEMMSHQPLGADYSRRVARCWSQADSPGSERRTHGRKMESDSRRAGRLCLSNRTSKRDRRLTPDSSTSRFFPLHSP